MKTRVLLLGLLLSFSTNLLAADYVGSGKCKMCHNKEAKGAQYSAWEATAHANALETLHNEQSAAIAAEMGLTVPAYEAPECLVCHVTGWDNGGYVLGELTDRKAARRNEGLANVGCEACHGAGGDYKGMKVMKGIWAGEIEEASAGMLWHPGEDNCVQCHNEKSPTYVPFEYDVRIKEVGHPYPEGALD